MATIRDYEPDDAALGEAAHGTIPMPDTGEDEDVLPPHWLTDEEFSAIFDRLAREKLGISGDEFRRRWDSGEIVDWDPELADLVILMPGLAER